MEGNEQRICVGRRQRRQQETRERLYRCAMLLLSEHDFHDVTVERITEAADVGKGTFFNYFSNKEAIVRYRYELQFEILSTILGENAPSLDPPLSSAVSPTESALPFNESGDKSEEHPEQHLTEGPPALCTDALRILERERRLGRGGPVWRRMVTTMHFVAESDGHSKQLLRNLLALGLVNDEVRRACLHVHERMSEIAEHLIVAGQQNGELRNDISTREMSDYMRSVYLNMAYQWAESDTEEDIHMVIDRNLPFIWSSLGNPDYRETLGK